MKTSACYLIFAIMFALQGKGNAQRCDLGSDQNVTVCGPGPSGFDLTEQQCKERGCCYNSTAGCFIPRQERLVYTYRRASSTSVSSYCFFPFLYKGIAYFECKPGRTLLWCGTTNDATKYYEWAYCQFDCLQTKKGLGYSGTIAHSREGIKCKDWTQSNKNDPETYPDKTVEDAKNYCRNPDQDTKPWCYVPGSDRTWDFCDIPSCKFCDDSLLNTSFSGVMSASSETTNYGADLSRIGQMNGWCAHENGPQPYLEVLFSETKYVYGIITKGIDGQALWTSQYKLMYSTDGFSYVSYLENGTIKIFEGNSNSDVHAGHMIDAIRGKGFRIQPTTFIANQSEFVSVACLQWDLIGCTDECGSSPCQNGATCVDGHDNLKCICVPGFTGTRCEKNIDECASTPCPNGATCMDRVNKFICNCRNGFTGVYCDINIDECASNPCHNEGSCVDEVNKFRCLCWSGTVGELCDKEVDDCISTPCQHGGTCTDLRNNYTCICPTGYGGRNCQQEIDDCASNPCYNGASCTDLLNDVVCTCAQGYTNTLCQTEIYECESSPCQNNGNCQDKTAGYTCSCPPGFTGVHCENDMDECISDPCVHGTCQDAINSYVCKCQNGYLGWDCDQENDECSSSPCSNGSICVDQVNGFTCQCAQGYTGELCQIDINECSSSPCHNGGSCKDLVNGYKCNCIAGYTGNLCNLVMVDGQWGGWGPWTQCSVKCGTGVHTRTRSCNNPTPQNGGTTCEGKQAVAELCYSDTCADIHGKWGMWGSWGKCSQTCNYGTMIRQRICDTPPPKGEGRECEGTDTSTAVCKDRDCGSPVDGGWSIWGAWVSCSTTCGVGTSSRTRQCNQPPPVYGGKQCQGLATNWEPCYLTHCPRYGSCSAWAEWTACSSTCGDGQRKQQRTCQLNKDTVQSNATSVQQSSIEYEVQHCEDMPCQVMECYHCSSTYTGHIDSLTCKGPTKQCSAEQKYCIYIFSKDENQTIGLTKRCGDPRECTSEVEDQCKAIYDQTIDSIITDNQDQKGPLEPHPDTLAQMWDALVTQCNICCTATRCNRGLLPSGNTIYTGGSADVRGGTWIVPILTVAVTYMLARD